MLQHLQDTEEQTEEPDHADVAGIREEFVTKSNAEPKIALQLPPTNYKEQASNLLIQTTDGVEIADSRDKAAYFSRFFQSGYTNEAEFLPPSTEELPTPSVIEILFLEGIVRRELDALNES
nr:unnamed protein product [Spirometra erinaceieuropaei]